MNPFKFGSVVDGEYFTNRKQVLKEVISDINSGQHVILISPRRFGKTSLINQVIKNLKIKYIKINMELITDEIDLANYYVKKVLSLNTYEKVKYYIKNFTVQPRVDLNPKTDDISISFSSSNKRKNDLLRESFELPELIANKNKEKILVVFDEFQDVRRISNHLEKIMRGIFQEHKNMVYVFIGSQESMIRDIFQNKKNSFYKFGKQITLQKISKKEFVRYIINRFDKHNIDCSSIIDDILDFTNCHPYYTQQLCYEIFNLVKEEEVELKKVIIKKAIQKIVEEHHSDFFRWWNNLTTTERKILIGIANGNNMPTSNEFVNTYSIKSASTSGSAVIKLLNKDILTKNNNVFEIEDPFWEKWIKINREK